MAGVFDEARTAAADDGVAVGTLGDTSAVGNTMKSRSTHDDWLGDLGEDESGHSSVQ